MELDGSQLYMAREQQKDNERTAFPAEYGLTVLRIPNNEVTRNFPGVCEHIDHAIRTRTASTTVNTTTPGKE